MLLRSSLARSPTFLRPFSVRYGAKTRTPLNVCIFCRCEHGMGESVIGANLVRVEYFYKKKKEEFGGNIREALDSTVRNFKERMLVDVSYPDRSLEEKSQQTQVGLVLSVLDRTFIVPLSDKEFFAPVCRKIRSYV